MLKAREEGIQAERGSPSAGPIANGSEQLMLPAGDIQIGAWSLDCTVSDLRLSLL
jgi:hypothetical protein